MPPPKNSSLGRGLGDLMGGLPQTIGVAKHPVSTPPPLQDNAAVAVPPEPSPHVEVSAEAALTLSKAYVGHIDLVMTDVVMPGMSGPEMVDALSEVRPEARFLFMSGYTDDAILRYRVLEYGLAFLQKPFSAKDLGLKLRSVLSSSAATQ